LGMKLTCGLEILAANLLKKKSVESNEVNINEGDEEKFTAYVKSLTEKGYFQEELQGSKKYNELLAVAKSHFNIAESPDTINNLFLKAVTEVVKSGKPLDGEDMDENAEKTPDDDSWMNHDTNSFDQMLATHFKLGGNAQEFSRSSGDNEAEEIPIEVKRFLSKVSDFQGAEIPGKDDENMTAAEEDDMNFDPDGFEKALKKVLNLTESEDNDDDDDDLDEDEEDMLDDDLIVPEIAQYDAEMKKELASSKVFSEDDNEKVEDLDDLDKPLDIDAKVLKNLLESFNSQEGVAGPAATLLQPMGIDLKKNKL